jgi:coproporphyrinogen III oxidase-like Fe-S oxidoreductase
MSCAIYINLDVSVECERYYTCLKKELSCRASNIPVAYMYITVGATRITSLLLLDISGILNDKFRMQHVKEVTIEIEYPGITVQELTQLNSIGINRLNISYTQGNGSVDDLAHYINEVHHMYTTIALDIRLCTKERAWSFWESFFTRITQLNIVHCSIEDESSDCFASHLPAITNVFEDAGFEQYELIHFARHGNQSYYMNHFWNRGVLYGFGLGAYSCIGDMRFENESEIHNYCRSLEHTGSAIEISQRLTLEEQAKEAMILTIRKNIGIEVTSIKNKLSKNSFTHFMSIVNTLVSEGLLWQHGNRIALTQKGQRVEQSIIQALVS